MHFADYLLIAAVVLAVVLALRRIYKNQKCGGQCACCRRDCPNKK